MTYIKLLTALAGLALLTACGGAAAPELNTDNDNGGDNPCNTNAFQAECNASDPAIIALRQSQCLADTTIDPTCVGETGIATLFCKDTPFNTDCNAVETAIISRQNQCLGNDAIHSTCGAVIVGVCEANPFQTTACLPGETYLPNRIAACIKYSELDMADKGNCRLITTDTAKNTMLTDCLENPFATACESVPAFMSSFADARTNLASFCDDSDNATDDLCKGESQMRVCGFDPFTAICPDATYLSDRLDECIMAGNAGNTKCNTVSFDATMNTAITDCLENPFATACESVTAFMSDFAEARTNRLTFCEANDSNALCIGANLMTICVFDPFSTLCTSGTYLTNRQTRQVQCVADSTAHTNCPAALRSLDGVVDTTDITGITTPTGVIDHADLPATVALATANTDISSHFLSVDADGVIDSAGLNATPLTLSRAGDAMDGVTYVRGFVESSDQSFVGLLPTTNLGAPLPSNTADATWTGSFFVGQFNFTRAIDFTINFGAGTIDAVHTEQMLIRTTFDLDFTATGVITGDVNFGNVGATPDIAQVRGLIGEQGLVGGFANTDGGGAGVNLYGGFVADNPNYTAPPVVVPDNPAVVEYNDWLAIGETVATPSSPAKNEFISRITTAGIRDGDGMLTHLNFGHLTLSNAKYKGVAFGGDDNDGFSPVYGDGANVYVGILPTTNLGAPLTQTTASAVWQGVLWASHKRISENGSFTPTIDFTAKTMTGTIADRAMDDTDFAVVAGNTFPRGVAYSFTASFDNPRGQLTGTITRTSTIDSVEVVSAGVVRGIIGEEGAVAGFISNGTSTDLSYTGGFVARPTQ